MAENVTPRVKVPSSAAAGETIIIKTLICHQMESGQRKDKEGNTIPRSIINRFTCDFNGENVIDVKMEPSISTNPYLRVRGHRAGSRRFRVHLVRRRRLCLRRDKDDRDRVITTRRGRISRGGGN